jgi:hypothetical protein
MGHMNSSGGVVAGVAALSLGACSAVSAAAQVTIQLQGSRGQALGFATISDAGTDMVRVELSRSALASGESIRSWHFNVGSGVRTSDLKIVQVGGPIASVRGFEKDGVRVGDDTFNLQFDWSTQSPDASFDANWVSAVFTMSGQGLRAQSFADASGMLSAAQIESEGGPAMAPGNLVLVPLPAAALPGAACLGILVAAGIIRRRKADAQLA